MIARKLTCELCGRRGPAGECPGAGWCFLSATGLTELYALVDVMLDDIPLCPRCGRSFLMWAKRRQRWAKLIGRLCP